MTRLCKHEDEHVLRCVFRGSEDLGRGIGGARGVHSVHSMVRPCCSCTWAEQLASWARDQACEARPMMN